MKKHLTIFLFLFLTSCELIVDIDVPFDHEQLTLNSAFNADSVWAATLSLNRHILDESAIRHVENAVVIVYQDGSPIDTLIHRGNGLYKSGTGKPVVGNNYEIRAMAEQYPSVVGRSYIPMPAPITSVEITTGTTVDGQPDNTVFVKFKDDPATENYYEVTMELAGEYMDYRTNAILHYKQPVHIERDDLGIESGNTTWDEGIVFRDLFFNGKEAEISFKSIYPDIRYGGSVIVYLHTLSKDEYQYKTTAELQISTSGSPFAQPVNVYSNIENGFGIFAGSSQSTFTINNPKPSVTNISPMTGKPGDHIIIMGENLFIYPYGYPDVLFSGVEHPEYAQVLRSTETELEVAVPSNAVTGKIYVRNYGGVVMSEGDFEVVN